MYGDGRFTAWIDDIPRGRRTTHQIHWRGTDAEGDYQFSSRVADSNVPRGSTLHMGVITAARQGAVLNICMTLPERVECRLALVRAGEAPMPLSASEPHVASHGSMVADYSPREVFYVAMRRNGGPVVYMLDPRDLGGGSFDIGANLGEAFVGLASTSLGSFFVLTDRMARLWQAVVEQEDGVGFPPMAAIRESRVSICRQGEAQASVRWPTEMRLRVGEETIEGRGYAQLSLSQAAPCVSGFGLSTDPVFATLRASGDGRVTGFVEREGGLRQISCTLR